MNGYRASDTPSPDNSPSSAAPAPDVTVVTFARSGNSVPWDPGAPSLWQFADDHGVEIPSGCLYGDCGTCMTPLLAGQVKYLHPTGAEPDAGTCLPCSCKPLGSITLDA